MSSRFSKINWAIVIRMLGVLLILNAFFMFVCVPVGWWYGERSVMGILIAGFICGSTGAAMAIAKWNARKELTKREGYLIVTLGWISLTLFGALPYFFSAMWMPESILQINDFCYTNAVFETMSGYTTTGATMLKDIEIVPKSLLMWRSMTHWMGGMGIIVLTIAILPLLGIGGMQLFVAEATGVTTDKLHPRITDTAKRLWILYIIYTLIQTLLLWIAGMNFFDAINHAMSTMATGGFSTKNNSIAFWNDNPAIQYLIILFMILAGANFVLGYFALKKKWDKIRKNTEFKVYIGVIVGFSMIIASILYWHVNPAQAHNASVSRLIGIEGVYTAEESIRHSLFSVVSVLTSTGFVTENFAEWTSIVSLLFIVLMFTGAMAGSTAGGIKLVRHIILIKNTIKEIKLLLHPNAVIPLRFNGKTISPAIISNVSAFFVTYLLFVALGMVGLAIFDTGSQSLVSEVLSMFTVSASFMGNIGPSFGVYDPVSNFSEMADGAKWISVFLMLIGRLELFTVLILFTPYFWKK